MDYIIEFVKSQLGRIILSVIGVTILTGVLYGMFSPSAQERLETAQSNINALFTEEEGNILRTDVTEQEINAAQRAVNRLDEDNNQKYQVILDDALNQFEALQITTEVFEGNALKSDQPPLIKKGVTVEQIDVSNNQLNNKVTAYNQKVKQQLEQAKTMIPEMDSLKVEMGDFNNIRNVTRGNLYEVVAQSNSITESALHYANQPYLSDEYGKFTQSMETLASSILNGYSYGAYEQLTIDEIFANPILSEQLRGTPLNPLPKVSLTFDDGPNTDFTPQVLDILAQNEVKGTFFVYGAYVDEFPDVARRIVDEGHILANHSYSHPDFSQISDEEVIQQIEWTQESIYDATGYEAFLYRMPFGSGGPRVVQLLPNYTSVIWNLDSLDWHLQDADAIYENVMANISNDSLILMHDTGQYTVDALARFVPELKEHGYQFVTPMEMNFQHRFFDE